MYEDKTLVCKECGQEFVFTAGEQEFYACLLYTSSTWSPSAMAISTRRAAAPSTSTAVPKAARRKSWHEAEMWALSWTGVRNW